MLPTANFRSLFILCILLPYSNVFASHEMRRQRIQLHHYHHLTHDQNADQPFISNHLEPRAQHPHTTHTTTTVHPHLTIGAHSSATSHHSPTSIRPSQSSQPHYQSPHQPPNPSHSSHNGHGQGHSVLSSSTHQPSKGHSASPTQHPHPNAHEHVHDGENDDDLPWCDELEDDEVPWPVLEHHIPTPIVHNHPHQSQRHKSQEPVHSNNNTTAVDHNRLGQTGSPAQDTTTAINPLIDIVLGGQSQSPNHESELKVAPTRTAGSLTPNGIKAGIAGGDAYPYFKDHIGWWYDWTPNPYKPGKAIGVPMLWGGGTADPTDANRLAQFKKIKQAPQYVLGYEEPDCAPGSGSAGMGVDAGVEKWESLIAPLRVQGSLLGSPSMCKQADETWLKEFKKKIRTNWDFTAIHVNKNNLEGVKRDIDYYWNTYGKPIWVTEFACVNDHNAFVPCTNQGEINTFINAVVPFFESHPHVHAYAYSNGLGLGDVWPLMRNGQLTPSGRAYLAAVSRYH